MRGRLIRWLYVDFQVLDKTSSAANRDDVQRTFTKERPFGARGGVQSTGKTYQAVVRLKAQVEITSFNASKGAQAGNVPDYRTAFVVHFKQLEDLSLVDSTTGKPLLERAKVVGIYRRDGTVERLFDNPPVHVVEMREIGYGLGYRRNLLLLVTDDRPQGLESTT